MKSSIVSKRIIIMISMSSLISLPQAHGDTWIGATGDWFDLANWDNHQLPYDYPTINNGGTAIINGPVANVWGLQLDNGTVKLMSGGIQTSGKEYINGRFEQYGGFNNFNGGRAMRVGGTGVYQISGGSLYVDAGITVFENASFSVIGGGSSIVSYDGCGLNGTLVSTITSTGIAEFTVTGMSDAYLSGTWNVIDDGAPLGKFYVVTKRGWGFGSGIHQAFSNIHLPGSDWNWGMDSYLNDCH